MGITRLNPAIGEVLVSEQYRTTIQNVGNSDTVWRISATKSGYTPIMFSNLIHGWSSSVLLGIEHITMQSGSFSIDGFARKLYNPQTAVSPTVYVNVLWRKD